jgi:hypothetical protein
VHESVATNVDTHERVLRELVDEHWRPACLSSELVHLDRVARVQAEVRQVGLRPARRTVWTRDTVPTHPRASRTVRVLFFDVADLELLLSRRVEPMALFWAGRVAPLGPLPAAVNVIAVLPRVGWHRGDPGPPDGLLSLGVRSSPSPEALDLGLMRWATAVEQALAIRFPASPQRSTVAIECRVPGRDPLVVQFSAPEGDRGEEHGTLCLTWESAPALWAHFSLRLTLFDAILTGICEPSGDRETLARLIRQLTLVR